MIHERPYLQRRHDDRPVKLSGVNGRFVVVGKHSQNARRKRDLTPVNTG
jgi:hypothetical protein